MTQLKYLLYGIFLVPFMTGAFLDGEEKLRREKGKRAKKNKESVALTEMPSSGLKADQTYGVVKGFEGAVLDAKSGYVLPYRYKIMRPEPNKKDKLPLFIVFHGVGRVGSDNKRQVSMGLPLVKELTDLKVNALVVQPQTAAGWAQKMVDGSKPVLLSVVELIDHLIKTKSVDPDRVYVLGNSMGCGGVWNMVFDHPEYLAGAVPVVGGALNERASEMADLPVWMFTAEKDSKMREETSRKMHAALVEMGRTNVKHTHYEDLSHANTFSNMFERDKVAAWLLKQKRLKSSF